MCYKALPLLLGVFDQTENFLKPLLKPKEKFAIWLCFLLLSCIIVMFKYCFLHYFFNEKFHESFFSGGEGHEPGATKRRE
jgi:hypothetical protein